MNRLGFHYFPDTIHYRQSDLENWLPRLKQLGAGWLVLQAPAERALPESFLRGLLEAAIEPVLHFPLALDQAFDTQAFEVLFQSYARWGVRYVALFDRPNLRSTWGGIAWAQTELVERFIDRYLPLAEACLEAGLIPVFPPLEPGGDYWDTSFLKAALESLQRRGKDALLSKLVLGVYAAAGSTRSIGARVALNAGPAGCPITPRPMSKINAVSGFLIGMPQSPTRCCAPRFRSFCLESASPRGKINSKK